MVYPLRAVVTALIATVFRYTCMLEVAKETSICQESFIVANITSIPVNNFALVVYVPAPVYVPTKTFIVPAPPATTTIKFPYPPTPAASPLRRRRYDADEEEYLLQLRKRRYAPPQKTSAPLVVRPPSHTPPNRQTKAKYSPSVCNTASYAVHSRGDVNQDISVAKLHEKNGVWLVLVLILVTSVAISRVLRKRIITCESPIENQVVEYRSTVRTTIDYTPYRIPLYIQLSHNIFNHIQSLYIHIENWSPVIHPDAFIRNAINCGFLVPSIENQDLQEHEPVADNTLDNSLSELVIYTCLPRNLPTHDEPSLIELHLWYPFILDGQAVDTSLGIATLQNGLVVDWIPEVYHVPGEAPGSVNLTWAYPSQDLSMWYVGQELRWAETPPCDPTFASCEECDEGEEVRWQQHQADQERLNSRLGRWSEAVFDDDEDFHFTIPLNTLEDEADWMSPGGYGRFDAFNASPGGGQWRGWDY